MKFKFKKKKIFCIEGDWNTDLRKSKSVLSILDFLKNSANIDYIHRNCSTRAELEYRLKHFNKYSSYSILYLAFHGSSETLHFGEETISIEELQEIFRDKLESKIVYFGSCQTLKTSDKDLISEFLNITKASCVVGFTKDVDFFEGTIIDILFFNLAQNYIIPKALKKRFYNDHDYFCKKYGFKIITPEKINSTI